MRSTRHEGKVTLSSSGRSRRCRGRALRAPATISLALALAVLAPGIAAGGTPRPMPASVTAFPGHAVDRALAPRATRDDRQSATRLATQLTLGQAQAATLEIDAGKRTGYLFSATGRRIASKTARFRATDAHTATRMLRKGRYTYHLLSWGPLAGYWVPLGARVRLISPTEWNSLILVYRRTNLDFVDASGALRHLEATMTAETESLMLGAVTATPGLVESLSSAVAGLRQTVVYPDRALNGLTPLGGGAHWLGPWDIAADLAAFAAPGAYDSVLVVWQPWDGDDYVESWGWGLGLSPGTHSNGAAYATITTPPVDRSWWVTSMPEPGELYLHEWLHGVIDHHIAHGASIPDLHAAASYGYVDEAGSWSRWYADLMQEHVRSPAGGLVGIDYRVWSSGTPRSVL